MESEFKQKKINHLFHYTKELDFLLKIVNDGFIPSYCDELIGDFSYLIPMVSFCNIPISDTDLYMRYGRFGIGVNIEWAVRNSISPVVYVHETTPFRNLHSEINMTHIRRLASENLSYQLDRVLANEDPEGGPIAAYYQNLLSELNDITIPMLQFSKNWKTNHNEHEIITYQEREWRFVPNLKNTDHKRIYAKEGRENFNQQYPKKPHLPDFILRIESISDIKYILIESEGQREMVLSALTSRFDKEEVTKSILSGNLLILSKETIHADF